MKTDPLLYSAANLLARRVWRSGPLSKADLVPVGARVEILDEPLALAVGRGWLQLEGDVVVKGSTNPTPLQPIGDPGSRRWGPGSPLRWLTW